MHATRTPLTRPALYGSRRTEKEIFATSSTGVVGCLEICAMNTNKRQLLEATVRLIQHRWGTRALYTPTTTTIHPETATIPSGFPALDEALYVGGFPRGRITELLGAPSSGMTSLALAILASAQASGEFGAYIDLGHTFDAEYATARGVKLSSLLLIRPQQCITALAIASVLVSYGAVGVLIFDSIIHLLVEPQGRRAIATALRRILSPLAASPCALIFLTPLPFGETHPAQHAGDTCALAHYATLRLLITKERLIAERYAVHGAHICVTIIKSKLAPPGRHARVSIGFS